MGLDSVINSEKKIIALIALGLIGAGFLADFITTIVWFSRVDPYLKHSYSKGKKVYAAVTACWVLSLVGLIVFALLVIFAFFVKSLFEKIAGGKLGSLVCIAIIGCLAIGVFISGVVASSYTFKNYKEYYDFLDKTVNYKCYAGPNSYFDIIDDDYESEKLEKQLRKALKCHDEKVCYEEYCWDEEVCTYTDYLCAAVGAPTLVFGILLIVGCILFIVISFPYLNDSNNASNNSENENDNA